MIEEKEICRVTVGNPSMVREKGASFESESRAAFAARLREANLS
jgi:hypothetical protein